MRSQRTKTPPGPRTSQLEWPSSRRSEPSAQEGLSGCGERRQGVLKLATGTSGQMPSNFEPHTPTLFAIEMAHIECHGWKTAWMFSYYKMTTFPGPPSPPLKDWEEQSDSAGGTLDDSRAGILGTPVPGPDCSSGQGSH
jgi:hypothetical protein